MNNNIILLSQLSTFGRGRDKFKRKKKDTIKGHVAKGAIGGALIKAGENAIGTAALLYGAKKLGISNVNPAKMKILPNVLKSAAMGVGTGAAWGALGGGALYGAKKKLKKDK